MRSRGVSKKCFIIADGLEIFIIWSFQYGFFFFKCRVQVSWIQRSTEIQPIRTVQTLRLHQYEPIPASYTPRSQHIYFSCKTADCKAVFAQSPNNYPITVFVVQGIERGLPAVDWVKFLWLASHPSEKIHNDEGVPGQVLMYGSHRTPVLPSESTGHEN